MRSWKMAIFSMRQGSDDRPALHLSREPRQMFTNLNAGNRRRNWLEFPTDFCRRIGFQIQSVQVAGAAGQEYQDDRSRPDCRCGRRRCRSLAGQKGRQPNAQETTAPHLEELTTMEKGMTKHQMLPI